MKIALHNPFYGQLVAETELSRRIYLAATNLGWEVAEVAHPEEINDFEPDFVLVLHNNSPKVSQYPTYGCMWNPPVFFEGTEKLVQNVLSYDGYLISSKFIKSWLYNLHNQTHKKLFTVPFYTSCPENVYQPPNLENPRLAYLGSNWDGYRFQEFFTQLDQQSYLEIYGNSEGWKYLKYSYQGMLPFDGCSVIKILNKAGVGLCLHREEHTQNAVPSMRIFEIVASGAVAICGEHPFIREIFADSVFYFDSSLNIAQKVDQISELMARIKSNPQEALEMSAQAHHIFLQHYSLENLLLGILPFHQDFLANQDFRKFWNFRKLWLQVKGLMAFSKNHDSFSP